MRLSYGQLFAVLFLFRAFTLICSDTAYSGAQMAGAAVSVFVQFIIVFPVIRMYRNGSISAESIGGRGIIFALYFVFLGMMSVRRVMVLLNREFPSFSADIIMTVFLVGTALYCAKLGLKASGRSAVMILGLFIFFLAILLISCLSGIKLSNIHAYTDEGSIIYYALRDFADSGEILAVFALPMFTGGGRTKGIYIYFASKLLLTEMISLLGMSVLGRVSDISDYPFFEICSFSNPFSVQRSDALFIMAYALTAVLNIAVDLIICDAFAGKYFKYTKISAALLMLLGGITMRRSQVYMTEFVMMAIFIILGYAAVLSAKSSRRKEAAQV